MIIHSPIKLICTKCEKHHTIKNVKHISIDAQKKQIFLDDKIFSCKKCKSTSIILLEKDKAMTKEQIFINLFEFSSPTYYKWAKHQNRKIFKLLDYAFNKEELEEYLNSGAIQKIHRLEHLLEIEKKYNKIVGIVENNVVK